jgi:hypothetical protein
MKVISLVSAMLLSAACFSQQAGINIEKVVKEHLRPVSPAKTVSFNERGNLLVPENYSNKRTGTKDSEMGELTRPGFLIGYDIGYMAGTHIAPLLFKEYRSYYNTSINGQNTWIGLKGEKLVITIYDPAKGDQRAYPANFWAIVKDEKDVAEVLSIVFSYKPKKEQ